MKFTLPTGTITSISGAALLTITSTHQVAASVSAAYEPITSSGSIRAGSNSKGTECSFTNAFRVQDKDADTGILSLGCGDDETCVEDETSSVGGRCVNLHEGAVVVESHRELVDCTFANGTSGTKCIGFEACAGADQTKIGCGSCFGTRSCAGWSGDVTVGEGSCIGTNSCRFMIATTVPTTIGDNSCHDDSACTYASGSIGSNSCVGGGIAGGYGYIGYGCFDFGGDSIGSNSCIGYASCYSYGYFTGTIGNDSCQGSYTCNFSYDRDTGSKSCNGYYACSYSRANVRYNSCNGREACYKVYYTDVGNCLCNGDYACSYLAPSIDKDYDVCVLTAAPVTAGPTSSATDTPIASPSISPTLPTKSPLMAPSTSPSVSPSDSPTPSPISSPPTHSPVTVSPTKKPIEESPTKPPMPTTSSKTGKRTKSSNI